MGVKKGFRKWVSENSLWVLHVGSSCCTNSIVCAMNRMNIGKPEARPEMADILLISGTLTRKSEAYIRKIVERLSDDCKIVSIGECSCNGGVFVSSASVVKIDDIVEPDFRVNGCSPDIDEIERVLAEAGITEKVKE